MQKYLIIAVTIIMSGCDYYDNSFKVTNRSIIRVAVEESNHPDSIFFNNLQYYLSNIIEPDSTATLHKSGKIGAWRRYVKQSPTNKLYLYVFAIDTLNKYREKKTMYNLYAQDKYIKKYELSEKQLDSINWKITFQ